MLIMINMNTSYCMKIPPSNVSHRAKNYFKLQCNQFQECRKER